MKLSKQNPAFEMKYGKVIIAKSELELIKGLVDRQIGSYKTVHDDWCIKLRDEIETAIIKEDKEMPKDVVRLNSVVDVETPFGVKKGIMLVKPMERNIDQNKISFLSPMGSAILGYAKKDEVVWNLPKGESVIRILDVTN